MFHFDLPIQFNKCLCICDGLIPSFVYYDTQTKVIYDLLIQRTDNSEVKNTYVQK